MYPVNPSTLSVGGPALNPLAAALMQGGMPDQAGAPPGAPTPSLLQSGGPVPGSIPIGAPANQFGTAPGVPVAPGPVPPVGSPAAAPSGGVPAPAPGPGPGPTSSIGSPAPTPVPMMGPPATRPFGFGGLQMNRSYL